jgi:hypothetical protein
MAHWISNRGKLLLAQGVWDDAGATLIRVGLLVGSAIPAAADTEAEIQDIATVTAFLALTGVDEPTGGWYARQNLTRTNATQDDPNNRVNLDASDTTFTAAAVNGGETHIGGAFYYDATTDTNDTTRQFMSLATFATPVALNGSNLVLGHADVYRGT